MGRAFDNAMLNTQMKGIARGKRLLLDYETQY